MAQLGIQIGVGFAGNDPDGEVIDDFDLGDDSLEGRLLEFVLRVGDPLQAEFDRRGVEILAVMKLDPFAQAELPGRIIDELGVGGQQRLKFHFVVAQEKVS